MDGDEVWAAIEAQRLSLADVLDDLTPEQWEQPSLCQGWRVRDVVAHVASTPFITYGQVLAEFVRARGNLNRTIRDAAIRVAARSSNADLLELVRRSALSRRRAPATKPLDPLFDALVHTQDIALPLGIRHPMPLGPARVAASYIWERDLPGYSPRKAMRGLHLVATDIAWEIGEGQRVCGPIQSLVLVMSGRAAGLPDLVGEGTAALTSRLPSPHGTADR
ncbi:maleylpyruvate isomerase family mycothiol-dependent enzyme [Nonomuraea ceibae]|uniref:maleylpyruvate isomerase family mycothiol-dependent enzyme n=1 Tax=Nonomuraea ceibae TaxID=1935170 RepID=UPI001C606823|nr:maleylpyruvate isomerase family mycothiol-dependent enzyme [Nonomuraea ceibae]